MTSLNQNKSGANIDAQNKTSTIIACVDYAVVCIGLLISIPHLKAGIQVVTGIDDRSAWLTAILIELAIVALKGSGSWAKVRRQTATADRAHKWLYGLLVLSAGLNCMYYWDGKFDALSLTWWLQGGLGCLVPAIIFALSSVAIGGMIEEPEPEPLSAAELAKQQLLLETVAAVEEHDTRKAAAKALKVSEKTIQRRLAEAREIGLCSV